MPKIAGKIGMPQPTPVTFPMEMKIVGMVLEILDATETTVQTILITATEVNLRMKNATELKKVAITINPNEIAFTKTTNEITVKMTEEVENPVETIMEKTMATATISTT